MPVYNESATIRQIVDKVMAVPLDIELIIVNDASTDDTGIILQQQIVLKYPAIKIFTHDINKGKAAAIKTAIPYCTGQIISIQDGDLETDPNDLIHLTAPIRNGAASVVYGSRYLSEHEPHLYRSYQLGGRLLSWAAHYRRTGLL
jgi:glycosyltransferase involved in cell wall biosynthesis